MRRSRRDRMEAPINVSIKIGGGAVPGIRFRPVLSNGVPFLRIPVIRILGYYITSKILILAQAALGNYISLGR